MAGFGIWSLILLFKIKSCNPPWTSYKDGTPLSDLVNTNSARKKVLRLLRQRKLKETPLIIMTTTTPRPPEETSSDPAVLGSHEGDWALRLRSKEEDDEEQGFFSQSDLCMGSMELDIQGDPSVW